MSQSLSFEIQDFHLFLNLRMRVMISLIVQLLDFRFRKFQIDNLTVSWQESGQLFKKTFRI